MSAAGLTLSEPILPLKCSFDPTMLVTTKVENTWTDANNVSKTYKVYLPVASDPSQKELFIYVIDQFVDAMADERLHLNNIETRYNKFRQVVDGTLRIDWQAISDERDAKTDDTFWRDILRLINLYFSPSSRLDQEEYLKHTKKPYDMTVNEVSARLKVVNRLSRYLPGSWVQAQAPDPANPNAVIPLTRHGLSSRRLRLNAGFSNSCRWPGVSSLRKQRVRWRTIPTRTLT